METPFLLGVIWRRWGVMGTGDFWGDFSWKRVQISTRRTISHWSIPNPYSQSNSQFNFYFQPHLTFASVPLLGQQEVIFTRHWWLTSEFFPQPRSSWSCFVALEVIAGWQAEFNMFELPGGMNWLWRTAKVTKLSKQTGPGPQPTFQRGVVTHQPEQEPSLGIPGFYKRVELGRHASSEDTQRAHTYCRNSM